MKPVVRRSLIAAGALLCVLVLAAAAAFVIVPRQAQPVGPDRYPAPSLPAPAGCDAHAVLAAVPHPASYRAIGMALQEARQPWSALDRASYADVSQRLGLEPAAAAFARAKACPAFEDPESAHLQVHQVLRAALLDLVGRELKEPGSARADLLEYLRLTEVRAHSARELLALKSALEEASEVLEILARAGIERPARTVARRSDAGRIIRMQLAKCRELVVTTKPSLGFDPGLTYAGCERALGPWIDRFERGAPRPPEYEQPGPLSWRNREGDQLVDALVLSGTLFGMLETSFEAVEKAEHLP